VEIGIKTIARSIAGSVTAGNVDAGNVAVGRAYIDFLLFMIVNV
jgi:hypothetical protein